MNRIQRVIVLIGALGVFFTSLVPPAAGEECRFHMFTESALPYSSLYGAPHPHVGALISEYGLTLSMTAMAFLIAGFFRRSRSGQQKTNGQS